SDPLLRVSDYLFHHLQIMSHHPPDRFSIIEISAVLQTAKDTFFVFHQFQRQIKFSSSCLSLYPTHLQPPDLRFFSPCVLQHHHDLKQWTPAQIPIRIDFFHQPLERHFLVHIGL